MSFDLKDVMDVFQTENYVNTELLRDKGAEHFCYLDENDGEYLMNVAIKREIPEEYREFMESTVYDLESPYGYGGFRTNITNKEKLDEYILRYRQYCQSKNIVAEFYRNNPLNRFSIENQDVFDFYREDRITVLMDLSNYADLQKNYSSSLKRNITKANRNDLKFEVLDKSKIDCFIKLYSLTMKKNNADDFYFFTNEYFQSLIKCDEAEIVGIYYEKNLINMAIMLKSDGVVYYHLGASHPDFYTLNGNPLLFDNAAKLYSSQGYKYLYMGGGSSTLEDDPLLKFKKSFQKQLRASLFQGLFLMSKPIKN
ncbi:GNAT family N-acetyltransferase [Psychrosphaera aquimarina]|uniref:GNAT family N-acetyltransferase n=1 Tax=Psychrosphaera aquimarina TaxID=2044854 RepID=A0ABU3R4F2_9GAMM|nr:GNAT family N-acetyltransferase [Psychrosphaera aquimarina]MDU0114561.1 GNAT family N-acetyltransferase [Psychrosphaera aquimarina]